MESETEDIFFTDFQKKKTTVLQSKKMSPLPFPLALDLSVALFLVELCWPVAYFLFFPFISLSLYNTIFVEMTISARQERIKGTEKASPIHTLFHR